MNDKAEEYAAILQKSYGLSEHAADMSLEFVKLAVDLASFNNFSTEQVQKKLFDKQSKLTERRNIAASRNKKLR